MEKNEQRIEEKISRTAEFTCMIRSASFYEKTPLYKSNDYIAPVLVPKFFIPVIKIRLLRNFFIKMFFPPGMYEYVIARTKFIDSVFQKAIYDEFDQILIFGAGFDSRGVRFAYSNKKTKIFELDAPVTQEAKINQFKKRGVKIHPNIIFVSINFNKESVIDKLLESGFRKNKKSLFILEGLTMYLNSDAVDNTFNIINQFAADGSEVIFDYVYSSVIKEENLYYGESEALDRLKRENEPWSFGIEEGKIESFLDNRNLRLIRTMNSKDLEKEFFQDEKGDINAKVNGTHCIIHAIKK